MQNVRINTANGNFVGAKARVSARRRNRSFRCVELELLESRQLLAGSPPFAVGGDPSVNPSAFRVTTFASGLTYPKGMTTLSDGSLLVGADVPGTKSYYDPSSKGEIVRFTDINNLGVADKPSGTVLYTGLPGQVVAVKQAGHEILALSSLGGHEQIAFLKMGATPDAPLTLENTLVFNYSNPNWEHTSFELAVRHSQTIPNTYDVVFNIGSEFNGVTTDSNGNIIPEPTTGTAGWTGIATATNQRGDAVYDMTLTDNNGVPSVSNIRLAAFGLRNAASMVFDPATGDLIIADNGMDGIPNGNEAWSADTLDRIPAALVGNSVVNFGFPYTYYRTTDTPGGQSTLVNPDSTVPAPLYHFDPLVDTNLPTTGSESEGAAGIAIAPKNFPGPLSNGVFVGFHGLFNTGGTTNEENPVVFASLSTQHYFDFVSNDLPNIGHIDGAANSDSTLYLSDISSNGDVFGSGGGQGMIYAITSIYKPPVLAPIPPITVNQGSPATFTAVATDPNVGGVITYSLAPGSPQGASIDPRTGAFIYVPNFGPATIPITVIATDSVSQSSAQQTVQITVNVVAPPPKPPVLAPLPPITVNEGTLVTFQASATDPNPGETITYNLGPDAPPGAKINYLTGVFSYTPLRGPATFSITVFAFDTSLQSAKQTFTLTVNDVAPILAPIARQTAGVNSPFQFTGGFTDPGRQDTWAGIANYGDGTPQSPVTVNPNQTFQLSHSYSLPGTYTVVVAITDNGNLTGYRSFLVQVIEPIPSSFNTPGRSQPAVFRPSTAQWFAQGANGAGQALGVFGVANFVDVPVAGNYQGTGFSQQAVFRPSTAQWFAKGTNGGGQSLGIYGATQLTDIPISGDFLGLGYDQKGVFRSSTAQWFVQGPKGTVLLGTFGEKGLVDIPVPGDYDGVGHTELAVFRASTAQWFILRPSGGQLLATFGEKGLFDLPAPGNYDGLGRTQVAVFRPSTAQWFVNRPTGGALLTTFGEKNLVDLPTETPVAALLALGFFGGIHSSSVEFAGGGLNAGGSHFQPATPLVATTSPTSSRPASSAASNHSGFGRASTTGTPRRSTLVTGGNENSPETKVGAWHGRRFGRFGRVRS